MGIESRIKTDSIAQLRKLGQSLWLDNIERKLISSGELAELRDDGVTGVTSNPTIFEKAVTGSSDYDEALQRLVSAGRQPQQILWDLMVEDIQGAADVFRPVFDETKAGDGYVSIEVSPEVASSTQKTIAMAEELRARCARPNVMVKIPATKEGVPAIADQIGKGHNINVTLIFSVDRYREVADAFLSGLETLQRRGGDLSKVASVASFFVSRVDTKVDAALRAKVASTSDGIQKEKLQKLLGKAGIANSKVAYEHFKGFHSGKRWQDLVKSGARVQRCLWASTSTKDPAYRDTMYVEELIGPETINTLPNHTLEAFKDHGVARPTLESDVSDARRQLSQLAELGIDLDGVTRELEIEGIDHFEKSYESLTEVLRKASLAIQAGHRNRK
jgi:transaldolase